MKIALIQQSSDEDIEANVVKGLRNLEIAANSGAELVVYPEVVFTRFFPVRRGEIEAARRIAETIPGPTAERFQEKARELGVVTVINIYERDGDCYYDSSPVIDADGSLLGVNRMLHICDFPGFHEQDYYDEGDTGTPVFDTRVGKIGVAICYDRHYPEVMRAFGLAGAEVVVVPQAGVFGEWPEGMFEAELRVSAFQNGYFAALANRVGDEGELNFAGESFVTDPEGVVLARAAAKEEAILYADLDFTTLPDCTARRLFLKDRRLKFSE